MSAKPTILFVWSPENRATFKAMATLASAIGRIAPVNDALTTNPIVGASLMIAWLVVQSS